MQQLYPELKPYREFFLPVTHGHSLYVELCGNPQGMPVVVIHGALHVNRIVQWRSQ